MEERVSLIYYKQFDRLKIIQFIRKDILKNHTIDVNAVARGGRIEEGEIELEETRLSIFFLSFSTAQVFIAWDEPVDYSSGSWPVGLTW